MADQTVSLKLEGDAEDLKRAVNESGDAMDDLAGRSTDSAEQVEQSVSGASSAWEDHSAAINGAGAAVAAMGAAVEGLARKQQDTRAVAGRLANTLEGETTDSVMGLAGEIHNATTDLDELVHMMEVGSQQGIRSGDDLQEYALFWDMVGDATGETAGTLADASVALRTVGIDAGNEAEALDAFGFIAQETTGSVGEFLRFIERTGPELRDMNVDIDDAAALMGALEGELGMSGRTARQEFRTAVSESDGTLQGLMETMGISQDQFQDYRGQVSESSGVIRDNADAYAESRTRLQELSATLEGVLAEHSGLVDSMSVLSPVLMGTGGAVFAFSQLRSALSGIGPRLGTIGRVLGRGGAVLGGLVLAREAVGALADVLQDAPTQVDEFTLALEGLAVRGRVPDSVADSLDGVAGAVEQLVNPSRTDRLDDWLNSVTLAPFESQMDLARAEIGELDAALAGLAQSGNTEAVEQALDILGDIAGDLGISLDELVAEHFPEYAKAADRVALSSDGMIDSLTVFPRDLPAVTGALDDVEESAWNLNDALNELIGVNLSSEKATLDWMDALAELGDKVVPGANHAIDENTQKGRDNRREMADLAGDLLNVIRTREDEGATLSELSDLYNDLIGDYRQTAIDAGLTEDQVEDLIEQYGLTPEEIITEFLNNSDDALSEISRIHAALGRIPSTITTQHRIQANDITRETAMHGRASGGPVGPELGPVKVGEFGMEMVTFGEPAFVHDAATSARAMSAGPSGARTVQVSMPVTVGGRHMFTEEVNIDALTGEVIRRSRELGGAGL